MQELTADEGVFLRSMASRGQLGGLAPKTAEVMAALDAAGKDVVIVETLGAGQDEVDIAGAAQTTIVLNVPGSGDDVQAMKAGLLEAADILVVNKADTANAARVAEQLHAALCLSPTQCDVPVLLTVATTGEGVRRARGRRRRAPTPARGVRRAGAPSSRPGAAPGHGGASRAALRVGARRRSGSARLEEAVRAVAARESTRGARRGASPISSSKVPGRRLSANGWANWSPYYLRARYYKSTHQITPWSGRSRFSCRMPK